MYCNNPFPILINKFKWESPNVLFIFIAFINKYSIHIDTLSQSIDIFDQNSEHRNSQKLHLENSFDPLLFSATCRKEEIKNVTNSTIERSLSYSDGCSTAPTQSDCQVSPF